MSPPESGRHARAGSNRLAWLGALGALLVALLVMSNVLLWQIADQRTTTSQPSAGTGGGASQPLLPPPSSGTSNKANAAELDRLTRVLGGQFKALQAQLTPLTGGLSAVGAVPGALGQLSGGLDALAAQGRALVPLGGLAGTAAGSLRQVAARQRSGCAPCRTCWGGSAPTSPPSTATRAA